jgi:hypothetical protein
LSPSAILFGAAWTFASALAAGALIARHFTIRFAWPLVFLIGACPLSLFITLLALAGLAHKGVFLGVGAVLISGATVLRAWRTLDRLPAIPSWFWIGYAPFTLLYLANAMAPELSPDGMAYHLGLVQLYYREHKLIPVPENMYAGLSQGVEMLFLYAFAFGRHSAAAMVHFTYLTLLPLAMADFGFRHGRAAVGAMAALLFYATPIVGIDGISAYVDVAVATIWFALFVVLEREDTRARTVIGGMLAGFAFAAKYTAATAGFYLAWRLRRRPRELAIAAGVAALFALPWIARNWISLGNPFAPFFNAWFPNPHLTAAFESEYSAYLRHYDLTGWRDWIWQLLVRGEKTGGFLGPVWALAPLGFGQTAWIFAALTYPLNVGARFLIPALPFLALGMASVLMRVRWLALTLLAAHLVSSWPLNFRIYASEFAWGLEKITWKQALRRESEEGYLNFKRGEYRVARMVEDFVPPDATVFALSPLALSYTTRRVIVAGNSAHGQRIRDVLLTPVLDYYWPTWRHTVAFSKPTRTVRLVQSGSSDQDIWSVSQVDPAPTAARTVCAPDRLPDLLDRNPLTRWHTGRHLRPNSLELDFAQPVDRIVVWMTRDQWSARLSTDPESTIVETQVEPPHQLRRWASETLRSMGVRYLVVARDDAGFADFAARPEEWNLVKVAERGPTHLYKIK